MTDEASDAGTGGTDGAERTTDPVRAPDWTTRRGDNR